MSISKKAVFIITVISFTLISGVAYALGSSDFLTRAQTWTTANCNQALLNSKNSDPNNEKAATCYNFYKNSENSASLSTQQQQLTNIQNTVNGKKTLTLYDNNNVLLGLPVKPYQVNNTGSRFTGFKEQFFNTAIQKIVAVSNEGNLGEGISVSYTNADCTGDTYLKTNGDPYVINELNDSLLKDDQNQYYVYVDHPAVQNVQIGSLKVGTSCQSDSSIWPVIKLQSISLPIPGTIAMPIDYRYE